MTLGPCADALGISVMMVFLLGVIQLPIMIALALHYPAVRADIYSTSVQLGKDPANNNSSAVILMKSFSVSSTQEQGEGYYMHGLNISGLFVLCAASFTFFVVLTMHLVDRGRTSHERGGETDFTRQNISLISDPSFRTWNQAFLVSTLLMHMVLILAVCSPVSTDMLLSSAALLYVSLCQLVQPLDNYEEELSSSSSGGGMTTGAASMAAQTNMLLCIIFCSAILFALTRIPVDESMGKTQSLLILVCLDAFMLFGHLWDRVPVVQVHINLLALHFLLMAHQPDSHPNNHKVVLNCRLLYICLLAIFNMGFFCLWDPYMKTIFIMLPTIN